MTVSNYRQRRRVRLDRYVDDFRRAHGLVGRYGTASSASPYSLTPASYNSTIPAGGQISFGFNGNSGNPATPSLTIGGQKRHDCLHGPGSDPKSDSGSNARRHAYAGTECWRARHADDLDPDKFLRRRLRRELGRLLRRGGRQRTFALLEDGTVYTSGNAPAATSGSQSGTIHVGDRPYAAHALPDSS